MKNKQVQELMNFSQANYCYPLKSGDTFRSVLECLSRKGCHRVPMLKIIENDKGIGLSSFVTQSQIVNFIATNLQQFGSVLDTTVLQAGLGTAGVISLKAGSSTIEALRLLMKTHVTGFPVIDESNRIVNVFSARDLRHLASVKYAERVLTEPVEQFLEEVRADVKYLAPKTVAICSVLDTMRTVITKMNGLKIHRLFLVSPHNEPIGVVTLTDAIKFMISHEHLYDEHKLTIEDVHKAAKENEKQMAKEQKEYEDEAKRLRKVVKHTLNSLDDD